MLLCSETIKYKLSCSETVNPVLGWNVVMSVSWYLVMLIPASSAFQLSSDQREDNFFQIFQVFSRSSFVLDLLSLGCSAGSIYGAVIIIIFLLSVHYTVPQKFYFQGQHSVNFRHLDVFVT